MVEPASDNKQSDADKLWVSRDASGTGLYTLWAHKPPMLDKDGYYKMDTEQGNTGLLLMTIHESKWPWPTIKMDRGESREVYLIV